MPASSSGTESEPLARGSTGSESLNAYLGDRRGRTALFTFQEDLRPGAREIVARLRRAGVRHAELLSGDGREAVRRLGLSLGFDEAKGEMTPAGKLEWIRANTGSGAKVLFVGDGLNDAPTLAAASASASFAEASQLSRTVSDFLILGKDLSALSAARRIAARACRLLAQNIGWALAYNISIVPLAALGALLPWEAALGMSASSLLVVANATRLLRPAPGESVSAECEGRAASAPASREYAPGR
jgi:P-type Cu2+ transporter